jgi:heme-degrading monooxygenase HmoA
VVTELVDLQIEDGSESDFIAAYQGVVEVLKSTYGCRSVRLTRGVESPSHFVLLVEWDSLEAHRKNFRETDRVIKWRAALNGFFAREARMEHFMDIRPED